MKNGNLEIIKPAIFAGLFTISCYSSIPVFAADPVTTVVSSISTTMSVKEILDQLQVKADAVVGTAVEGGDYLVEKTGRKLGLAIDNLDILLSKQRNSTFDQLDSSLQQGLLSLEKTLNNIDSLKGQIMEIEHFLAMDIQNVVNDLPFTSEKYSLRDIQGYSQIFQPDGSYSYRLLGNAFAAENKVDITINGVKLDSIYVDNSKANISSFSIPAEAINGEFKDTEVSRINFEVSVQKKEKNSWLSRLFGADEYVYEKIYTYQDKVLLLPRYPATYELKEHYSVEKWSEKTYWSSEGSASVGATGESAEGENPHKHVNACATIPNGTQMIQSTISTRESYGGWGRWDGGPWYSNEGRTVCKRFKHWVHDKGRTVYIKVQYKKPEVDVASKTASLNKLGENGKQDKNLEFGAWYESRLSSNYQSFDLIVKYFNGKKYSLTPTTLSEKVNTKLENKSNFKRLLVLVNP
ncbi:hypothetical protein HJP15_21570 [Pseudoalteromonas sp. NEC-BIFX-2020_002]|uniref:hypothetical protein n=1 Tax=Pseudoalteromonas sp. NEC-BIFX-2020_002 TaxID=2732353 RepID=UPI001476D1D2|nr:hypothetical protein [Pseudoalteromonas sp. NEC-BIFX-2020_002]NNG45468.1 hypothetical protein [Pseudoalteromonas sp. NEC-BIFX-2020_002]